MTWTDIVKLVIYTLIIVIPLVYNLWKYVKLAMQGKNWKPILKLVMDFMSTAEGMYDSGADRKEWVMSMVETAAKSIGSTVNMDEVSEMIDNLCKMSKNVNIGGATKSE